LGDLHARRANLFNLQRAGLQLFSFGTLSKARQEKKRQAGAFYFSHERGKPVRPACELARAWQAGTPRL